MTLSQIQGGLHRSRSAPSLPHGRGNNSSSHPVARTHQQHPLPGLHGVCMHLDRVGGVLGDVRLGHLGTCMRVVGGWRLVVGGVPYEHSSATLIHLRVRV